MNDTKTFEKELIQTIPFTESMTCEILPGKYVSIMGLKAFTDNVKYNSLYSTLYSDLSQLVKTPRGNRIIFLSDGYEEVLISKAALLATKLAYKKALEADQYATAYNDEFCLENIDEDEAFNPLQMTCPPRSRVFVMDALTTLNEKEESDKVPLAALEFLKYEPNVLVTRINRENATETLKCRISSISSMAANIFVSMTTDAFETTYMQNLVLSESFQVIKLPKLPTDYFYNLAKKILAPVCRDSSVIGTLINTLKRKMGTTLSEEHLATYCQLVQETAQKRGDSQILLEDVKNTLSNEVSEKRLMEFTGMDSLKKANQKLIALKLEGLHNPKLGQIGSNYLFVGNPGTGKTTGAHLLAREMADNGVSNGNVYIASRSDIIGEYVGHTAPNVEKLFRNARGGILFVDEAGFFTQKDTGGFVNEAMKEFIRFMEIYRDVTVIFALYKDEEDAFLNLDSGLTSRLSGIISFPDYTTEELVLICSSMFSDRGYELPEALHDIIIDYAEQQRAFLKVKFGNAREMRRLVEEAIAAFAMREKIDSDSNEITKEDLEEAIQELNSNTIHKKGFGFSAA